MKLDITLEELLMEYPDLGKYRALFWYADADQWTVALRVVLNGRRLITVDTREECEALYSVLKALLEPYWRIMRAAGR